MRFEYSVIPAPSKGEKAKDAKTPTDRYALAVSRELNRMAQDGWEYLRADVLPTEERSGLTGRATIYHNILVFRREMAVAGVASARTRHQPQPEYPAAASPAPEPEPIPALPDSAAPRPPDHPAGPDHHPQSSAQSDPGDAKPPAPRTEPTKE